ncbi:MAG: hypothetical protein L0Z50_09285 [Verrucomicrobiales bacterium]|nr:hypothetical protein [Verrucomicrobiales bacterium]
MNRTADGPRPQQVPTVMVIGKSIALVDGEAAERAHPGRSGFERSRSLDFRRALSSGTRCGQDGRAPTNRRGLRRFWQFWQILTQRTVVSSYRSIIAAR